MTAFPRAAALAAALALLPVPASADPGGRAYQTFQQPLPNVPGKTLTAVVVEYPPGGTTPPHRHAPSGFVFAYVLEGSIRSKVGDAPVRIYRAGESWYENPGDHHVVSENASETQPARLLAVFVADDGETLTTLDGESAD
ncbi:MAG TPA: cupin domain-containing protein [Pseudomonadales bacterium]